MEPGIPFVDEEGQGTIHCPPEHKNSSRRPLCCTCRTRLYRAMFPTRSRIRYLKARAKVKRVPFDLDEWWLLRFMTATGYDPTIHHIDRKVVSEGYTKNNLQVLSISDNCSKSADDRTGMMSFSDRYKPVSLTTIDLCPF